MLRKKNLGILFTHFCDFKQKALKAIWSDLVFNEITNAQLISNSSKTLVDHILDMQLDEVTVKALKQEGYS